MDYAEECYKASKTLAAAGVRRDRLAGATIMLLVLVPASNMLLLLAGSVYLEDGAFRGNTVFLIGVWAAMLTGIVAGLVGMLLEARGLLAPPGDRR